MRKGLPVRVIAETPGDNWRKIEDADGDQCWVHKVMLSGVLTAQTVGEGATLYHQPFASAHKRAQLGPGVIVRVDKLSGDWVRVRTPRTKGWVQAARLWGGVGG